MSKTSLDKSKIKFLLELKEKIADAHFVGIRSRTQLTAAVLDCAKSWSPSAASASAPTRSTWPPPRERGIPVFNAPFSNTRSVAELVLAEAMMLLRGIPQKNACCHRGGWIKSRPTPSRRAARCSASSATAHIGTQLGGAGRSPRHAGVFYDVETKLPLGNARQLGKLDDLLGADVVSLHVPERRPRSDDRRRANRADEEGRAS
jgi:D-3-phosphoglycerate dehydrogenase / 2-oxoglutarate reductase